MILWRRTRLLDRLFRNFGKRPSTSRSVVRENFGPRRDEQLQTRFLNFLERPRNTDKNASTEFDKRELDLRTLTSRVSVQNDCRSDSSDKTALKFEALVTSLETRQQHSSDIFLSTIDDECCDILRKLSASQILRLLHLLTKNWPHRITFFKFYKHSLVALRKSMEARRLNTQQTLQLLFFESLRKKKALSGVKRVMDFLPPLKDLSLMQQCVVAHVAFKCAIRLKDAELLHDIVEKNAGTLVKDTGILVTFCKALRLAGPTSDCSLENLSSAIVENPERFRIKCAAHILALYSEAKLESRDVLQRLFEDSMRDLSAREIENVEKDVDRLLWASGVLNYELKSSDTSVLTSFIDGRYEKLAKKPFYFANILLSLWILNCRLKDVVAKCLANQVFLPVIEERELWKPVARLNLLLSCVRIEAPEIELPDEILRPPKVGMKIRESVKRLRRLIERLAERLEIDEVVVDCPVDGIYIPGVSFRLRKRIHVHVDLLDETTCFKRTEVPLGLVNLKLRLLSKIGYRSVLITEEDLKNAEVASTSIEKRIENIGAKSDEENSCEKMS